eukprot:9413867-Pyramimonas_sp.AAC.1
MEGGVGSCHYRIQAVTRAFQEAGVLLAFLSEPCMGPGAIWPDTVGYSYIGERSAMPDTVAVLIRDDVAQLAVQVPGV